MKSDYKMESVRFAHAGLNQSFLSGTRLFLVLLLFVASNCVTAEAQSGSQAPPSGATAATNSAEDRDQASLPFVVPDEYHKLPEYALVVTTKGPFEVKLYRELTPVSVANFEYLGRKGFYEGLIFHRYVPNFVIQGGDPLGTGKGDPGWNLPPEIAPEIRHVRGTIGWARKPATSNPERLSNGSQFYIGLTPQPRLDGFYTVFGVVVKGMENVERLRAGDKILKIRFPLPEPVAAGRVN